MTIFVHAFLSVLGALAASVVLVTAALVVLMLVGVAVESVRPPTGRHRGAPTGPVPRSAVHGRHRVSP